MSVQRRDKSWRVRWREGDRWRSRTFDRKADALLFDAELRRKRRLGELAWLDAGAETLDSYVTTTWAPTYAALLAPKTRALYTMLYDHHISSTLGGVPLREELTLSSGGEL
jgi:integrase